MAKEQEFYTLQEVAELLRVSKQTIRRRVQSGELKAHKTGGRYIFHREDIQAYLNATETKEG